MSHTGHCMGCGVPPGMASDHAGPSKGLPELRIQSVTQDNLGTGGQGRYAGQGLQERKEGRQVEGPLTLLPS